jgi:hypothetical protein
MTNKRSGRDIDRQKEKKVSHNRVSTNNLRNTKTKRGQVWPREDRKTEINTFTDSDSNAQRKINLQT